MGRILSRFFRYLPNSVVPAQARICPGPQLTDTSMLGRIPAFAGMTLKGATANAHGGQRNRASATGRLREAESVALIIKGRGDVASLCAIGLGMRTNAAPCMPTLRLGPGPYVRHLSYECGSPESDP
jgi:hypothetical protein